jgi:vancomycin permeability regulator SanA
VIRTVLRWTGRVVATFLIVAVIVLLTTAYRIWEVGRQDHRPHSDAIVVLGAAEFNGRPSEVFAARLDHAVALYKAGVAPVVMTLGGARPGDVFSEGAAGADYVVAHGVPRSATLPVGVGFDTLGSLRAAARVFDAHHWHTAVLVTDPWHELRSQRIAEDQGMKAATSPSRTGPVVHTRGTELRYIARETLAFLYDRIFHRSFDAGPRAV